MPRQFIAMPKTPYPRFVQEEIWEMQKRNFDKHHSVRLLKKLEEGDAMWITDKQVHGVVKREAGPDRTVWRQRNFVATSFISCRFRGTGPVGMIQCGLSTITTTCSCYSTTSSSDACCHTQQEVVLENTATTSAPRTTTASVLSVPAQQKVPQATAGPDPNQKNRIKLCNR